MAAHKGERLIYNLLPHLYLPLQLRRSSFLIVKHLVAAGMDTDMGTNTGMGMETDTVVLIDFKRRRCLYCLSMSSEGPSQAEEKKETIATCLD